MELFLPIQKLVSADAVLKYNIDETQTQRMIDEEHVALINACQ